MSLALLLPLVLAQSGQTPPRGLACLTTWYAGEVAQRDGGWGLELGDGAFVPWTSPGVAANGEPLASLSEIYQPPYVTGPIVPIDTSDAGAPEDPGRVRVEELFRATYGGSREAVQQRLAKVRFFGLRYPFHEKAAPALERVVARLTPLAEGNRKLKAFLTDIGGTWHWRTIKRSRAMSSHAFGIAIDLNAELGDYWRWTFRGKPMVWKNRVPQEIVDAFEAEGFIWGGRWKHYDTMHFEYRPELLSPDCR